MENNKEKRIIFATGNAGKMREIRAILSDLGLPVLSMKEAGVVLDIVEDGKTFAENAKIKAMAVWKQTGGICQTLNDISVFDLIRGIFSHISGRVNTWLTSNIIYSQT